MYSRHHTPTIDIDGLQSSQDIATSIASELLHEKLVEPFVVILVGRDYPSALADLLDSLLVDSGPLVAFKVRAGLEAFIAQGAIVRTLSCKWREDW